MNSEEFDERSLEEIIPPEGKMNSQAELEISDLERAHEIISNPPSQEVVDATITNPVAKVEEAVANYVSTATEVYMTNNQFSDAIRADILRRLPSLSNEQVLGLFGTDRVTGTDQMAKLLGPTFQLMTARQQAEIAEKGRREAAAEKMAATGVQVNIGNVGNGLDSARAANESLDKNQAQEVLQGLTVISQLIEAQKKADTKKNVVDVSAEIKPEE